MRKSKPPDESAYVSSAETSDNYDKKVSFGVTNKWRYESFDDHTFFGDTGTSHVMDIDADGFYDA